MASVSTPIFQSYIGIDYSGAKTPKSSLRGLRVFSADRETVPFEVEPPISPRKYWTRLGIAEWLAVQLSIRRPTIVGIDHAFSFPLEYFRRYQVLQNWPAFLEDFCLHWPTDDDNAWVRDVRKNSGASRLGDSRWRRLTEKRTRAKSVFQFDVQGSVAKSTHSGLPWLLYLQRKLCNRVHFWPFDGWQIPLGKSAIVEVYPALWSKNFDSIGRTPDQHDAYSVAAWLRQTDMGGTLGDFLEPSLGREERWQADIEGWILAS